MVGVPRAVARRIQQHCRRNEVVVVVPRKGVPARIFVLEKYLKMRQVARRVQPWKRRRPAPSCPDPLGAAKGRVLGSLSRREIYE